MSATRRPIVVRRNPAPSASAEEGVGLGDRVRAKVKSRDASEVVFELQDGKTAYCPAKEVPANAEEIEVTLLAPVGDDAFIATSREPLAKIDLQTIQPGDLVRGRVSELKPVGLQLAFDGARGFAPARQLGGPVGVPTGFQRSWFVGEVIDVEKKKKQIICGVRKAIDRREIGKKREFIETLEEGGAIEGTVTRMNQHGAFVDVGHGVEGLLHESKILRHMKESDKPQKVDVGEKVQLEIIQTDPRRGRVALGFVRDDADTTTWKDLAAEYAPGERVTGLVESVGGEGAVLLLEEKVRGLLSSEHLAKAGDEVRKGQLISASVDSIDEKASRIHLSL